MTDSVRTRIGICLLAGLLFGILPMQPGFAQGGNVAPPQPGHEHAPPVGDEPHHGTRAGPRHEGGALTEGQGRTEPAVDLKEIDTSIAVQPDRPLAPRDRATTFKIKVPESLRRPQMTALGTFSPAGRNAIGMPIATHIGRQDWPSEHLGPHVAPPPAAFTPSGINRTIGGLPIVKPNAEPSANAPALRGINGTAFNRPGMAPSGLGGPARTITGINGTRMRPKY